MLVEERAGERLHAVDEELGGLLRGFVDHRLPPALRHVRGLAGERHARQGLADAVEQAVDQALAGDRPARDDPGVAQGGADDRAACAGEQRAIEIEERGGLGHVRTLGRRGNGGKGRKRERAGPWGVGRPSQPGALRWGDRSGAHIEVDPRGDLVHFDLVTFSMPLRDLICPIVITGVCYRSQRWDGRLETMDVRQLQPSWPSPSTARSRRAAKALHTVQSNISAHVARLERELGVTLVDRHPAAHRRGRSGGRPGPAGPARARRHRRRRRRASAPR